jgi:hypothetical protein
MVPQRVRAHCSQSAVVVVAAAATTVVGHRVRDEPHYLGHRLLHGVFCTACMRRNVLTDTHGTPPRPSARTHTLCTLNAHTYLLFVSVVVVVVSPSR